MSALPPVLPAPNSATAPAGPVTATALVAPPSNASDMHAAPGGTAPAWHRWLREPLLHFVLIGGALFAVDFVVNGATDEARVIVVDESVDREALRVFKEARGREPDAEELYALRRVWLDNEVLYREGLALQMDKGDKAIKDRVVFKALSMINAGVKPPAMDEQKLRAWFEKNRARYDEPTRYDFLEAVLAGDGSEKAARAFAAALNAGAPPDAQAGLREFKGRPHGNIVQSYGADFARELEAAPRGEWRVYRHAAVWRVMRMEAITPGKAADFDTIRQAIVQDWIDAVMAEQRSAAVRELAKKYTVKVEASTP